MSQCEPDGSRGFHGIKGSEVWTRGKQILRALIRTRRSPFWRCGMTHQARFKTTNGREETRMQSEFEGGLNARQLVCIRG